MKDLQNELSHKQFTRDALLFNGLLGVLLMGSLRWNPEILAQRLSARCQRKVRADECRGKKTGCDFCYPIFLHHDWRHRLVKFTVETKK